MQVLTRERAADVSLRDVTIAPDDKFEVENANSN